MGWSRLEKVITRLEWVLMGLTRLLYIRKSKNGLERVRMGLIRLC